MINGIIQLTWNMSEKENINSVNRFRIVPNKSKKVLIKTNKELPSCKSIKQKSLKTIANIQYHPIQQFLFGTIPTTEQLSKFANLMYKGLFYSVCSLKGPTQEYLRKKYISLPEPKQSKKKFLILDLDETLIHSTEANQKWEITIKKEPEEESINLNIRPHCFSFLQKMSNYYEIYVFTASTQDYAEPIVSYLNQPKKTIQGLLSRNHCLQTHNGLRIKDLRIIKNRQLSDIVIVDNLVHSFGLQLDNGIPILDFTNNKNDRELLGLQNLLLEIRNVKDVRQFLRQRIALRKCLEISEDQFLNVGYPKIRHKN